MLVNPIIIILSVVFTVLFLIVCIIKKPNFPLLSAYFIILLSIYLSFAVLINMKLYSVVSIFEAHPSIDKLIKFIINMENINSENLEQAFNTFKSLVIIILFASILSIAYDIKRIYLKKK